MITLKNVSKTFIKNNENIKALEDFSYEFLEGKLYAITGHSGSGKSTLLSIIGLIQKLDNGTYLPKTLKKEKVKEVLLSFSYNYNNSKNLEKST